MAIKIQELELQVILQNFMKAIKADYDSRTIKEQSILGQMFYGLSYDGGKYDLYTEAVDLFITRQERTTSGSARRVSIRSYYDRDKELVPTMHIAAPSEQEKDNWIGGGFTQGDVADAPQGSPASQYYEQRTRRYQSRIAIIFTSDNWIEVQLMYFLVKHGILTIFDTLILSMFQDPSISGHELQMKETAAPEHFYSRSIIIDSANESQVSNFHLSESFVSIVFPRSNDVSGGNIGDEKLDIIINPLNN